MTEDVVCDDKGLSKRQEGTDAVRAMLADLTQSMPSDYRLDLGDLIVGTDDPWAAEWTMSGTNDREDKTRSLPNTGRPFRIQGLSIGRRRDEKVTEVHLYWNMADHLTQIGLMPKAPAPATPVTGWVGGGAAVERRASVATCAHLDAGRRRWPSNRDSAGRPDRNARDRRASQRSRGDLTSSPASPARPPNYC
jgi:hypothetical protein